ncbi:MAG: tetratricopeptide repeat protein [Muribaculaceae bacterium]|nr:tetratricopeptide repeat protein [Muribaculaceae bacterium]
MAYRFAKYIIVVVAVFATTIGAIAQINADQVLKIGRNALYFEDYILSIQYFNQAITAKPYLAEPYYYRAVAKISLEDYRGAEEDASLSIERNPFIVDAYQVRGVARQNQGKFREAIDDYTAGLKLMPYDKAQLLNLAACQIQTKDFAGAADNLALLQRLDAKNDKVYIGLAHLHLEQADTTAAVADAKRSLELNHSNLQAHLVLAQIDIARDSLALALGHLDEAIKLEPQQAGFFINRAYIKYKLDDYYGAMADFDYAIKLEPNNPAAIYNRAMLNAEVAEDAKAIDGFSRVLQLEPDNFLALYNRAILQMKTGRFRTAIADFDRVLARYPKFEGGYLMRSEAKRRSGDNAGAERDMNRAVDIMKQRGVHHSDYNPAKIENEKLAQKNAAPPDSVPPEETEDDIMNRFNELLTVDVDDSFKPEYSNRSRGRVQNAQVDAEPEPFFALSYYSPLNDDLTIGQTHYMQEVTALNDTRLLPMKLTLANRDVQLDSNDVSRHFASIDYYNSLIARQPRAIDFLARAMEQLTVKNPEAALSDVDKALELAPRQPIALFMRACARYRLYNLAKHNIDASAPSTPTSGDEQRASSLLHERENAKLLELILNDLNEIVKLSPRNIYAHYNRGIVYNEMQNYTEAIAAFSQAIDLKPTLGEAYFNRGLLYLRLGNKQAGVKDLSKAGELGVLRAYTILKRFQ